ncbi:MAG TPA: hypothetical protein VGS61_05595, partial [Acidimicrobiales bacterium]|nr:hypothetical protein [Acidimicrobiales bacterium]
MTTTAPSAFEAADPAPTPRTQEAATGHDVVAIEPVDRGGLHRSYEVPEPAPRAARYTSVGVKFAWAIGVAFVWLAASTW